MPLCYLYNLVEIKRQQQIEKNQVRSRERKKQGRLRGEEAGLPDALGQMITHQAQVPRRPSDPWCHDADEVAVHEEKGATAKTSLTFPSLP